MRTATAFALLAASLFSFSACSTYVNIPPQTGDVAGNDPNVTDVVTVQAKALKAVMEERPVRGTATFALPAGSNARSYALVQEEVGDLATHASLTDPAAATKAPTHEVRQVMIRGWYAQVDVVRPSDPNAPDSPLQLVTAYLKWQFFDGWYVQRLHAWHIPVDDALQKSRREAETETPIGPGAGER